MDNIKKSISVDWKFKSVVILKFNYTLLTKPFKQVHGCSIFNISPKLAFDVGANEVHITISIVGKIRETDEIFIDASTLFIYDVRNLNDLVSVNKDKTIVSFKDKGVEKQIVPLMIGVSYSTMRGIMIAKGGGTIMQVELLPIVNPQQFHKDFDIVDGHVKEAE